MISIFSPYFIRVLIRQILLFPMYYKNIIRSKNLYYIIIHDDLKPLFLHFFFAFTYGFSSLKRVHLCCYFYYFIWWNGEFFFIFLIRAKKKSLFVCLLVPPVNHQGEQHNIKEKMNQQNHDFSSESLSEKIAYYFFFIPWKWK